MSECRRCGGARNGPPPQPRTRRERQPSRTEDVLAGIRRYSGAIPDSATQAVVLRYYFEYFNSTLLLMPVSID